MPMATPGTASVADTPAGRILIVDDDDPVRMMLVAILEAAGYEVRDAADGADGLAVAGEWRPDVILLDLAMPGMTGREFLARRATVTGLPAIPVIVVTAATVRDVPSAEHLGVRAVVEKPHEVAVLRALIDDSLPDRADGRRAGASLPEVASPLRVRA
jgi:CheY-like chemotaxis protein